MKGLSAEWEALFANHINYNGRELSIYKEFKPSNKKTNKPVKNEHRILIAISLKKKYK